MPIESFEALLRWNHPLLGDFIPTIFIHMDEGKGTGLIDCSAIGKWAPAAALPRNVKLGVTNKVAGSMFPLCAARGHRSCAIVAKPVATGVTRTA